jgi:hypothetical protein
MLHFGTTEHRVDEQCSPALRVIARLAPASVRVLTLPVVVWSKSLAIGEDFTVWG